MRSYQAAMVDYLKQLSHADEAEALMIQAQHAEMRAKGYELTFQIHDEYVYAKKETP